MIKKEMFVALTFCLLFSFAAAQLSISEQKEVYNLGDKIYVTVDGVVGAEEGNLNLNLVCENQTVSFLKISARAFPIGEATSYSLPYKILTEEDLEIENITSLVGNCHISASLGSQIASTPQFRISDQVVIEVTSDKGSYNPGETMTIEIKTSKENGDEYTGEVRMSNFSDDLFLVEVTKTIELEIGDDQTAGSYDLDFDIWGDDGSKGSSSLQIEVNQIPSRISFGVNTLEVLPGSNLTISGDILDQSGEIMYDVINLEIISPRGLRIEEILGSEEEFKMLNFEVNATAGDWKIIATAGELRDELTFEVLPKPSLEYNIDESILTVTNTGNSRFDGYFNLTIGSIEREVYVDLEPAASKQFVLTAPHGDYEVIFADGEKVVTKTTFLTGNAISIKDVKSGFGLGPLFWLLIIVVLGIGGYLYAQRHQNTKKLGGDIKQKTFLGIKKRLSKKAPEKYIRGVDRSLNFTNKSPEVHSIDSKDLKSEDETMKDFTLDKLQTAQSTLVLKGEKVSGAVLSLKIANLEQLNEHSKLGLEKILQLMKNTHAVVDKRESYIFFLFLPQITKTYKNELLAVRAGEKIREEILNFNKRFRQKILFSLGVNSGDMIVSKKQGKITYTSLGNTLPLAKKLSESQNAKLLITDEIRKKLLRDLKVEKSGEINRNPVYAVMSVKDRQANKEKLKDLLKRSKND